MKSRRVIAKLAKQLVKAQVRIKCAGRYTDTVHEALEDARRRLGETQAELDNLRQARATERAQPKTEGAAQYRAALAENERLREALQAIQAQPEPVGPVSVVEDIRHILDVPELVGTVQAVKDLVAERDRLKADVDMRDKDVDELREQAERYRKTIRELHLEGRITQSGYADAQGPDVERPKATSEPTKYHDSTPRYEVRKIMHSDDDTKEVGYGVWDRKRLGWYETWTRTHDYTLDAALSHAVADAERLNAEEARRLDEEGE